VPRANSASTHFPRRWPFFLNSRRAKRLYQCGFCLGFGCEVKAKSSSLASMIPIAEKNRRCGNSSNSYVHQNELDACGRAVGPSIFDEKKKRSLAESESGHRLRQWRG